MQVKGWKGQLGKLLCCESGQPVSKQLNQHQIRSAILKAVKFWIRWYTRGLRIWSTSFESGQLVLRLVSPLAGCINSYVANPVNQFWNVLTRVELSELASKLVKFKLGHSIHMYTVMVNIPLTFAPFPLKWFWDGCWTVMKELWNGTEWMDFHVRRNGVCLRTCCWSFHSYLIEALLVYVESFNEIMLLSGTNTA